MRVNTLLAVAMVGMLALALAGCARVGADRTVRTDAGPIAARARMPPLTVREHIADARKLAPLGERVWPGFADAPFGIVLVEAEIETAFCHPAAVSGFEQLGRDPVTGCDMQARARSFDLQFLATFPALDGISTIVVGTPEATGLAPVEWTTTLLHEHFHQLQSSRPGYYAGVDALDLSGGDKTGMWMLDYPFPYDDAKVVGAFTALADALDKAVTAIGTREEVAARASYLQARATLRDTVSAADWRYFEFQLWQEGVARWTEIAVSESAAPGRPELAAFATARRQRVRDELQASRIHGLRERKRIAFYAVGASEAMLLEAQGSGWRSRYFDKPFALGPLFQPGPVN